MPNTVYKRVVPILIVSLIIAGTFMQCNTKDTATNTAPVINYATELKRLKKLVANDSVQRFTFRAVNQIVVRGGHGTEITIDPENLESELGANLTGKEFTIELIELLNQSELARADAQTVSKGQILVSGGAYWLDITSDGKNVKIKNGKSINIRFPQLSDDEMSLFYGQRDSLGQMNWQSSDLKLNPSGGMMSELVDESIDTSLEQTDTLYGDEKTRKANQRIRQEIQKNQNIEIKLYEAIQTGQLGWINVDRFYEVKNKKDFLFTFNPRDSVRSALVYMIFEDINSVLTTTYFAVNDTAMNNVFHQIPGEGKVKLIAVAFRNEHIVAAQQSIDLRSEFQAELKLEKTSEEKLANLFK